MECPFSLSKKTILITGATSGIGKATAIIASEMGATIIALGRNCERLKELESLLSTNTPHYFFNLDLNDQEKTFNVIKSLPKIDGAVFCAGVNERSLCMFLKEDALNRVINTNLISPMRLTQGLLKNKKINIGASLVFVSSVEGVFTHTLSNSIYGVSKSGLTSYVKSLALEVANKKIRANSVNPGRISTPLVNNNLLFTPEEVEKDKQIYPLKDYGTPQDVAYGIIYLLSDVSKWVTGTSLVIDGGLTIK